MATRDIPWRATCITTAPRSSSGAPTRRTICNAGAIAKLPTPADGRVRRVLDIGCSAGQSATAFKERFPEAEVWGVDNRHPRWFAMRTSAPSTWVSTCTSPSGCPRTRSFPITTSTWSMLSSCSTSCRRKRPRRRLRRRRGFCVRAGCFWSPISRRRTSGGEKPSMAGPLQRHLSRYRHAGQLRAVFLGLR